MPFAPKSYPRLAASFVAAAWLALAGCSSSSTSSPTPDASTPDASSHDSGAPASACGQPGDKGNSLGVGQYCTKQGTCPSTAPICSTINNGTLPADQQTFFCVLPCEACSPPDFCGTGASCVCNPQGCGCVPDTCAPDAGGHPSCATDAGGDGG